MKTDDWGFVAIPMSDAEPRVKLSEGRDPVIGMGADGEAIVLFDPFILNMTVLKVEGPMALVAEFGRMIHKAALREIEQRDEARQREGVSDPQGEVRDAPRRPDGGEEPHSPPGSDERLPL